MKRFLIHLSIFCVILLILALAFDVLISHYLKQSKTYAAGEYATWNDVYEGNVNSEIVISGSSRAVVQIDPAIIQSQLGKTCYNLGIDGNNIWLEYFRHQQLLKHNTKPSIIIHSLDIFMLSDSTDIFNSEQFLPYMLFNGDIQEVYKNNNTYTYFDFYIPLFRYFGNQKAILHAFKILFESQQDFLGRKKGYEAQNLLWNKDLEKAKLKMKSFEAQVDSSSLHLFEKYLQECKAQSINLVFVYTPEYTDGQRFVKNRKTILDFYLDLSKKYNITFFDYSDDPISHNQSYFYNSGHLNRRGSKLFTKKLASDLKAKKE
jgi:hypothetical protein